MPTVTDEDVLELVERFDISLEDTVEVERLQKALAKKLEGASGAPELVESFLTRFQQGLEIRDAFQPAGVSFKLYERPSTRAHPGGWYQPVYTDIPTGKFISRMDVESRIAGLRLR